MRTHSIFAYRVDSHSIAELEGWPSSALKESRSSARQGENDGESTVYTQQMSIVRAFSTPYRAE